MVLAFIKRGIMRRFLPLSGGNHGNNQSTVAKWRLNKLHLKEVKHFQLDITQVLICIKDIFLRYINIINMTPAKSIRLV